MPVGVVHMCLEYLINPTDVAPCLLAVGGMEGGRNRERETTVSAHKKQLIG